MTLRALVVDDEPLARTALVRLLKRERDIQLVGQCGDGESAVETIRSAQPNIVFLDIQMPEMDGFQVVETIGVEKMPVTVFVTAFDRYAIRAFDANAVDYLLKPFEPERFARALARARDRCLGRQDGESAERLFALLNSRMQSDYAQRIAVAVGGRIVFVAVNEIDWIEAEGNYARLHAARKVYDVRETLQSLMEKLDPREFVRVHRSVIVAVARVRSIAAREHGEYDVTLDSGVRFVSSRGYSERVRALLRGR